MTTLASDHANAWRLVRFPRKPFNYLRMGFPRLRGRLGALPDGALIRQTVPLPEPGPGDVVVGVGAVSLNFRDYAIALGLYAPNQSLPLTLCSDAAGTVLATGREVKTWRVGDRVTTHYIQDWLSGRGTAKVQTKTLGSPLEGVLRNVIVIPEHGLVRTPDYLTDIEAATLPIAALTAWSALVTTACVKGDEFVLVQGSGGVSLFGIQIAKALGLKVIATTGSAAKAQKLRELGADEVVVASHGKDWSTPVRRASGGGVDVVLDVGGGATVAQSVKALRHQGRVVCIGFLGGMQPKVPVGALILNNASVHGITVGNRADFQALCDFLSSNDIHPVIDRIFRFDEAPDAFSHLASGSQFGKICVDFTH